MTFAFACAATPQPEKKTIAFAAGSVVELEYTRVAEGFDPVITKLDGEKSAEVIYAFNKITYIEETDVINFSPASDRLTIKAGGDVILLYDTHIVLGCGGYFMYNKTLCKTEDNFAFLRDYNFTREAPELLGVWWWSDSLGDEYLDFAKDNGVTEIYYCSSKFDGVTDAFISKANARGMMVYWLAGEYQWVEDHVSLAKQMERFVAYQSAYENNFAGVHLDIEPHQHPDFKSRRTELITEFVKLTAELKDNYPQLWIEYDIPFWLEDEITVLERKSPRSNLLWIMPPA